MKYFLIALSTVVLCILGKMYLPATDPMGTKEPPPKTVVKKALRTPAQTAERPIEKVKNNIKAKTAPPVKVVVTPPDPSDADLLREEEETFKTSAPVTNSENVKNLTDEFNEINRFGTELIDVATEFEFPMTDNFRTSDIGNGMTIVSTVSEDGEHLKAVQDEDGKTISQQVSGRDHTILQTFFENGEHELVAFYDKISRTNHLLHYWNNGAPKKRIDVYYDSKTRSSRAFIQEYNENGQLKARYLRSNSKKTFF